LTELLPIPLFQLHQMIFRIGQDSPVYGPLLFYMVPVVVSLNLLQAQNFFRIIYKETLLDYVLLNSHARGN
jgi:hypothetical protein